MDRKKKKREEEKENGRKGMEIMREEIIGAIRGLKKRTTSGGNGIGSESWIYATDNVQKQLSKIINRVWSKGDYPRSWRKGW